MKYLPTDVSSFSKMIKGNYIYVDKTKYIYDLYGGGTNYYFLSRPRRFGKSLLISTLKEFFLGNKALFEGLALMNTSYTWPHHPVIHLDFSTIAHATAEEFKTNLSWALHNIAEQYHVNISDAPTLETKLVRLVQLLSKINTVVLLVDEYDKPILTHINNVQIAKANREILKSFYDVFKGLDEYLRAVFITGVTKFAKTSIFSGINNVNDITMVPIASRLLGYTDEEIKENFGYYITQFAKKTKRTNKELMVLLQAWYNGYRFSEEKERVYNPFSVLYSLQREKFQGYWFESGTPTFLINLIQKQAYSLQELSITELSPEGLGIFDIEDIPLIPLLFQTGYLTIAGYNPETNTYMLSYPNQEVSQAFNKFIVASLTNNHNSIVESALSQMVSALNQNDINGFCRTLQSLFAHIPYNLHIPQERYFHSIFQFLGTVLGMRMHSEVITDKGRIDIVVTTETCIYVFELKFRDSAVRALQKIEENKYYEKFLIKNKKIILVGLAFNYVSEKLVLNWEIKEH